MLAKINEEIFSENTRNDSYVVIGKDKKEGVLISYAKYLLIYLQKEIGGRLNEEFDEDAIKDNGKFDQMISISKDHGYAIYQLTRL